jgi:hypothetical protein
MQTPHNQDNFPYPITSTEANLHDTAIAAEISADLEDLQLQKVGITEILNSNNTHTIEYRKALQSKLELIDFKIAEKAPLIVQTLEPVQAELKTVRKKSYLTTGIAMLLATGLTVTVGKGINNYFNHAPNTASAEMTEAQRAEYFFALDHEYLTKRVGDRFNLTPQKYAENIFNYLLKIGSTTKDAIEYNTALKEAIKSWSKLPDSRVREIISSSEDRVGSVSSYLECKSSEAFKGGFKKCNFNPHGGYKGIKDHEQKPNYDKVYKN